jgi:hypothetical protein
MQGREAVDLTGFLRGLGWPAAAQHLTNLLALSGDPAQPFSVDLGQALLIDPETPVTYLHPVTLRRARQSPDGLKALAAALESTDGAARLPVLIAAAEDLLAGIRHGSPRAFSIAGT